MRSIIKIEQERLKQTDRMLDRAFVSGLFAGIALTALVEAIILIVLK